jgi:hypothetical protein
MDRPTKLDFARSNAGAASVHQTYAATAKLDKQLYGLLSWRNPHKQLGLAGVKRVFARIAKNSAVQATQAVPGVSSDDDEKQLVRDWPGVKLSEIRRNR